VKYLMARHSRANWAEQSPALRGLMDRPIDPIGPPFNRGEGAIVLDCCGPPPGSIAEAIE